MLLPFLTVTSEDVCRNIRNVKLNEFFFSNMRFIVMFVTGQQCSGTRPLKIRSPPPVQRKKNFSPREIIVVAGLKQFERTSYFLGIQAWVLRQNEKQKKYICAKEWSKKHIFHSHFFNFHHKPKRMLKFLQNSF